MKRAITDSEWSLAAPEFVWTGRGLTEAHQWIMPRLLDWLRRSEAQSVLDLGCGNGALTTALANEGYAMAGFDSSRSGLAIARCQSSQVDLIDGTLDEPLPPELHARFDAVIAIEVIEHLFLPRHLFQRASEALKPNGMLIVTTPYHGYLKNLALALAGKFDQHWHPLRDFGHIKFFSARSLSVLFQEEGYAVQNIARVGRVPPLARSLMILGEKVSLAFKPSGL